MKEGISFTITSDYIGAKSLFSKSKKNIVVAYIESSDDCRLWSNALKSKKLISSNIKLSFKAPSLDGDANGKSTLIRMYKDGDIKLGKNLILCLDSDYDYLIGQEPSSTKHSLYLDEFVFQTYSYSAENHYYTTEGLNDICERAVCGELDVELCLNHYVSHWSSVIYDVFCKLLFLKKTGFHTNFQGETEKLRLKIKSNFNGNLNIAKLGSKMASFEKDVDIVKKSIEKISYDSKLYNEFVKGLTAKGLNKHTTHMFFHGHDLEDLFLKPVCVSISKRIISNVKSNINKHNSGDVRNNLISEYENNVCDVVICIKNRTTFDGNLLLKKINADFDDMCQKFH